MTPEAQEGGMTASAAGQQAFGDSCSTYVPCAVSQATCTHQHSLQQRLLERCTVLGSMSRTL